jgi:DNA uptake protein ComE-like DNA-binding protein
MPVRITYFVIAIVCALSVATFVQSSSRAQQPINGSRPTPTEFRQPAKVNLNTATAGELRELPRLSAGSVSAILESRKKSSFKDWNDFVNRRLVAPFAQNEIRSLVVF